MTARPHVRPRDRLAPPPWPCRAAPAPPAIKPEQQTSRPPPPFPRAGGRVPPSSPSPHPPPSSRPYPRPPRDAGPPPHSATPHRPRPSVRPYMHNAFAPAADTITTAAAAACSGARPAVVHASNPSADPAARDWPGPRTAATAPAPEARRARPRSSAPHTGMPAGGPGAGSAFKRGHHSPDIWTPPDAPRARAIEIERDSIPFPSLLVRFLIQLYPFEPGSRSAFPARPSLHDDDGFA